MDSQHRQSQIALNGRVSDCSSRTGTVSEAGTVKYQVPVAQSGIGSCVFLGILSFYVFKAAILT